MTFFQRLKNLWELSKYRVDGEYVVPGLKGQMPKLVDASTPKRRPATIVDTKEPIDIFENDKTS